MEFGDILFKEFKDHPRNIQTDLEMPTPEEIKQISSVMQNTLAESIQEIKDDLSPPPVDPSQKEQMVTLLQNMDMESSFFVLVTVPCWLIYRISPTRLYRKARQGNMDALGKLLSLDPLMLHDPTIGKRLQEFRLKNKLFKYENLLEATLKDHHLNVTPQQMKYAAGGLISALASITNQINKKIRVTTPDIQKLFDAVAYEFDGKLEDLDLAVGSSFARRIYFYRQEWLKAFHPDAKK